MHVVVIGPPNSGKSTFTAALIEMLEDVTADRNQSVDYAPLDIWDNSGPWLLDETGEVPRRRDPDPEEEEQLLEDYREAFQNLTSDVNLADAPGCIDDKFRALVQPAEGFTLIISEERLDEKEVWIEESDDLAIDLLSEFVSFHEQADTDTDVDSVSAYFDPGSREGQVKNLSNEDFKRHGLHSLDPGTQRAVRQFAIHLLRLA